MFKKVIYIDNHHVQKGGWSLGPWIELTLLVLTVGFVCCKEGKKGMSLMKCLGVLAGEA